MANYGRVYKMPTGIVNSSQEVLPIRPVIAGQKGVNLPLQKRECRLSGLPSVGQRFSDSLRVGTKIPQLRACIHATAGFSPPARASLASVGWGVVPRRPFRAASYGYFVHTLMRALARRCWQNIQKGFCLMALCCLLAGRAEAAERQIPAFILRRVILLTPPCSDATARNWIAQERSRKQKPPRSTKDAPDRASRIARLLGQQEEEATARETATTGQLQAFGEAVFADAVALRLKERLQTQVLSGSVVEAALKTQGWTPDTAAKPQNAPRLCAELESDALLVVSPAEVTVQEGRARTVTFRIRMQLPVLRVMPAAPNQVSASPSVPVAAPLTTLHVSGEASVGRVLFRTDFVLSRRRLVRDAALSAAARAVHTLITGETDPLEREGVRLSVTPIPAPAQADCLRFTARGRIVLPGAVQGLITDGTPLFSPSLFPLKENAIIRPKRTAEALRQMGETAEHLWTAEGRPNVALLCVLGKRLQVDYVLFACIASVDVLDVPFGKSGSEAEREIEAQAEVAGGLVRVADGALLWQERANASMRERIKSETRVQQADIAARIAHQAEYFALLQLQRRFQRFRDHFAQ